MKIKVIAPARLHLGLIDCGNATDRLFGGIGLTIDGIGTEIISSTSKYWEVKYKTNNISPQTKKFILATIKKFKKQKIYPCSIQIIRLINEHVGLGSKTNLLLSLSKAIFEANEIHHANEELIEMSGRGGTSGIGVNTFFYGGIITDSGHNELRGERTFQPSSKKVLKNIPKIISRVEVPNNWRILLFKHGDKDLIFGEIESNIFQKNMPIKNITVLETLATVYHGVIPAFQDLNYPALFKSIMNLNNCGFKKIEVNLQSKQTKKFIKLCWRNNIVCGLSSFGPITFSIINDEYNYEYFLLNEAKKIGLEYLGNFGFNNNGVICKKIKE